MNARFGIAAFVLVAALHTGAQPLHFEDLGPLRIRDQFALNMGFLALDPNSADILENGRWQLDVTVTGTNSFAKSEAIEEALEARTTREPVTREFLESVVAESGQNAFYLDGEFYRTAIALHRGFGNRTQLGVTVQILDFGGDAMDSSIESFHDAFGLGQAGRLGAPRGDITVFISDENGSSYTSRNPGAGLGDTTFSLKRGISGPGTEWASSIELVAKAPTGSERDLYSSGSWDAGAQLLASRFFEKSCLHAAAGVVYLGENERLHTRPQTVISAMLGYEHEIFSSRNSLIIQSTVSQSPFRELDLPELAALSIQASIGVKCMISRESVLFVALTENLAHFDNTADIGLHLVWTGRF
ncbi:MAG: DUF3187 family protein [Thermoanaerobaculia bacterium]|nr:DUF3187 family protein [Thermoanaerobaculia bacterium]